MKTSFDLPDDLVAQLKARAARDGREVQEVAAGLLSEALSSAPSAAASAEPVSKHLPLIKARPAQRRDAQSLTAQEMCDFVKEVEQQQEVERFERALGHQHVDRARPLRRTLSTRQRGAGTKLRR